MSTICQLYVNSLSLIRAKALNDNSKREVVVQSMRPDEVGSMSPQLYAQTRIEAFIFDASRYIYPIDHIHFHFHFLKKTPTPRRNITKKRSGTRE